MPSLQLHHYGFLTADTNAWLAENELLIGKPHSVSNTIQIDSQKVSITFVEQIPGAVLTELVEPMEENKNLRGMLLKGISLYHTAYTIPSHEFNNAIKTFENEGAHSLPIFQSEAFENKRCVFLITRNLGMIEIIEQ